MTQFYQTATTDEAPASIEIPLTPPPAYQNTSTKVAGGTTSISFRGDTSTTINTKRSEVSARELTPFSADDWRSTARNSFGNPTSKITEQSVVTIDGMSAEVGILVKAGLLVETKDGDFVRPSNGATQGTAEGTEQETTEPGAMPVDVVDVVNSALDGMSDSTVQKAGSLGVAAAVGDMPVEEVVTVLARDSGIEPAEMAQRFSFAQAAFQSQADNFITKHLGIPESDLQNFYEFVRQPEHKGMLQNAIRQQVQANSMSAYKPLVDSYFANQAPSAAALQRNGFETKTAPNGEQMVRIQGVWMSAKVAAKTGLI
ncbi:hypothetical protein [Burkholderia vietnamiensis]|uniref:hypothetical protein n=1 Tax=Burkholderia vietnamiensis TaxID=60552 RepID=UPI0026504CB9|nr:hypothetical protein [Burkholderia vietnamiensis]MDN7820591.1 hypothetical protein [Burkholderia vietnamiensis]